MQGQKNINRLALDLYQLIRARKQPKLNLKAIEYEEVFHDFLMEAFFNQSHLSRDGFKALKRLKRNLTGLYFTSKEEVMNDLSIVARDKVESELIYSVDVNQVFV